MPPLAVVAVGCGGWVAAGCPADVGTAVLTTEAAVGALVGALVAVSVGSGVSVGGSSVAVGAVVGVSVGGSDVSDGTGLAVKVAVAATGSAVGSLSSGAAGAWLQAAISNTANKLNMIEK